MNSLYLIVDLCSLLPTVFLSFHPKLKFYKHWALLFPSILIAASIFIAFDSLYTSLGIWGFNSDYLLGYNIGNLPIEEILFFICIPYACIFSYYCLKTLGVKDYFKFQQRNISIGLIVFSIGMALYYFSNLYTLFAFASVILMLSILQFILKVSWLSRFYFAYLILQIPFLIVNGILTGTGLDNPVVWYNPNHIIGLRIHTIPFEDTFYGMSMLLLSLALYEFLLSRKQIQTA
jgi:lycopene cyclase domain-containing protein